MTEWNDTDRRGQLRVDFSTRIRIVLNIGGEPVELTGSSRDLSRKGIFVKTDRRFDLGSPCTVSLELTGSIDAINLEIKGTVVRQTETGVGISFDSMDVDTYAHLKNIVMYNQTDDAAWE